MGRSTEHLLDVAKIFIIDDDAAAQLLVDTLTYRGHEAHRVRSVQEAFASIDSIAAGDLVVLDLVMPHGSDLPSQVDQHRSSGMLIYRRLRDFSQSLPIIVYTANQDGGIIDAISADPNASYVPRWSGPSLAEFIEMVNEKLGIKASEPPIRTFIVHGHDEVAKLSLKNYLQNTLKLPEPIILHEQPSQGRTLIEKFEDLSQSADAVFVLLTPDDLSASASDPDTVKHRARQNVIFELGYFLGHLGRRSGRVLLLYKGGLELPSDISGLIYLNIDSGVESVGEQIRREINVLSRMGASDVRE
jgi:CheY-like chemotaxis protein